MAKDKSFTTKVMLAMSGIYFCGLFSVSFIRCFCSENRSGMDGSMGGSIRSAKQQALDDFRKSRQPVAEAYVISLHESKFNVFQQRHFDMANGGDGSDDDIVETNNKQNDGYFSLEWFQGYNGFDQAVLDEFSSITGLKKQNVSEFEKLTSEEVKGLYNGPHAVGCYLSHWRLLEKVQKAWKTKKSSEQSTTIESAAQKPQGTPDMLFVFEDDTHCVTNLIDRTWKVVQKLPKDWDILYIGGKPFSLHTGNMSLPDLALIKETEDIPRPSNEELARKMCNGDFGTSATGPFAPGTSAEDSYETASGTNLTEDPPYWQTKWILNTNSYVINPKRIQRVLRVLSQPMPHYKPIDVTLTEEYHRTFMKNEAQGSMEGPSAPLKAFLTPKMFCDQGARRHIINRNEPTPWEGFHWLPWRKSKTFPDQRGYVWRKIANRQSCAEFSNENVQEKK